jgi:hypothetical protein
MDQLGIRLKDKMFTYISGLYAQPQTTKVALPQEFETIKEIVKKQVQTGEEKIEIKLKYTAIIIFTLIGFLATVIFMSSSESFGWLYALLVTLMVDSLLYIYLQKHRKYRFDPIFEEVEEIIEKKFAIKTRYKDIIKPNKYEVTEVGYSTLSFQVKQINGKKYLFFNDNTILDTYLNFPYIDDFDMFIKLNEEFSSKNEIPSILEGEKESYKVNDEGEEHIAILRGYEKQLNDYFIDSASILSNLVYKKISSNIVKDESVIKYLQNSDGSESIIDDLIDTIEAVNDEDSYRVLEDWKKLWEERKNILSKFRFDSLRNDIVPILYEFGCNSNYSSFNFYCPKCNQGNQDDILSRNYSIHDNSKKIEFSNHTKCIYSLETRKWHCPTCGEEFSQPIPLHKSISEIVNPLYDVLMQENKIIREKAHTDIKNREYELLNEMKKETENILFKGISDIYSLQDQMEQYTAELSGEQEAIQFLSDIANNYRKVQSKIIQEIGENSREMEKVISKRGEIITAQVDKIKQYEMGLLNQELIFLSKAKKHEDEKRDALQRAIVSNLQENNEIARQGFSQVSQGINNLDGTIKKGISEVGGKLDSIDDTVNSGFKESNTLLRSQKEICLNNNAIQASVAKKSGIDLHDEPFWRLDKKINHFAIDATNFLTGGSTVAAEKRKMED